MTSFKILGEILSGPGGGGGGGGGGKEFIFLYFVLILVRCGQGEMNKCDNLFPFPSPFPFPSFSPSLFPSDSHLPSLLPSTRHPHSLSSPLLSLLTSLTDTYYSFSPLTLLNFTLLPHSVTLPHSITLPRLPPSISPSLSHPPPSPAFLTPLAYLATLCFMQMRKRLIYKLIGDSL